MCVIVEWRGAVCDREIKSNRDERALTRDGPRMRAGTLDSRLAQCGVCAGGGWRVGGVWVCPLDWHCPALPRACPFS